MGMNSVCGCAAGNARPAVKLAIQHTKKPDRITTVFAGVDNVFDRNYANHLNRGNLFDPQPVRINEPGRTFWVRLAWRGGAV